MIRKLLGVWNAWLRGDVLVAPAGARGRVYERKEGGPGVGARAVLKASLAPSRVYRAAEDAWYLVNPKTGKLTKE